MSDIVVDLEAPQINVRKTIAEAFQQRGPMTIADAMHLTGIHTESIRRYVMPPHYRAVCTEWATRQWQVTWELVPEPADIRRETQ